MDRIRLRDVGVLVPGASRSRIHHTTAGKKHVRFIRSDGEGPFALASDFLTISVMGVFGIARPGLAFAELPDFLHQTPDLRPVLDPLGLAWDDLPANDLYGDQILADARTASPKRVVAQYIVLDWVRSDDHRGKNFLNVWDGTGLMAVDFCRAPSEEAWRCQPIPFDTPDHGRLGDLVHGYDQSLRDEVCRVLDSLDTPRMRDLLAELPSAWTAGVDLDGVLRKLDARRPEVRARYE